MQDYQKRYIELKKLQKSCDSGPEWVDALYKLKDDLERESSNEAKDLLVHVYDQLNLKRSAFELLSNICSGTENPKTLKRLAVLKEKASTWKDNFALPRPLTPLQQIQRRNMLDELGVPLFRYHPDPLQTGAFTLHDEPVTCQCCGLATRLSYSGPFYSEETVDCLCPQCIANGKAAAKFDGDFQDDYSIDEGISSEAVDELIHRTPGYHGWQQEYWRAHCGDICAYLGPVGAAELKARGLLREVLDDECWDEYSRELIAVSVNGGHVQCYLFRCLHCGRHMIHMDCS